MNADDISKLVELTDTLVYQKTGSHLDLLDKDILRQVLSGKKNNAVHFPEYTDGYVQRHCAPKLWELLSVVIGQKVYKRNVLKVLQKIQIQRAQLESVIPSQCLANAGTELNGHSAQNVSVLSSKVSYGINPNDSHRQNHHLNSCHLQADHSQSPKVSDGLLSPTPQEFQASDHTKAHENSQKSNTSNFGLLTLINFRNFRQPGVPLLLSLGVLGCSFGLSWLANWYGLMNHLDGQLPQAQLGYFIALKLNPVMPEAHYNKGTAYEDQQNYSRAHTEYQLAIEGGLVEAYNNQARLYILQGKYDVAVSLLEIGLPLAKNELEQTNYSFLKNLGWARLEQGYLEQAKVNLSEAIQLESSQAPAYCLLAQLLERQGMNKQALLEWENCLRFSYGQLPEEDRWMHTAQQRLKAASSNK